jgi:hypothetical protein
MNILALKKILGVLAAPYSATPLEELHEVL